jgi:hypothetical protein
MAVRIHARAEIIAAAVLAGIFIIAVVLQASFAWGLTFVVASMAMAVDLCLRSDISRYYFRQPLFRMVLSTVAIVAISLMFWPPVRKQYMDQHLPPSFAYIVPGVWSPAPTPEWVMIVRHFGPHTVFKPELLFVDLDRAKTLQTEAHR